MGDIFNVPESRPTVATLTVNGESYGEVETSGKSLYDFLISHAAEAGIMAFSAYVDGNKLDSADAQAPAAGHSIEIVPKDTRGLSLALALAA